jgi:predicted amidohydrolase YtcJ
LLPGFEDAHCHVMAYASSLMAVDCRAPAVASIADINNAILVRARSTPDGQWVRAAGYHEFDLAEKRHPNRQDLDRVSPNHPVRLLHQSGHAMVLNSLGLLAGGITSATDEPPGGTIDRDSLTGEPTGLLLEMSDYVRDRIPRLTADELGRATRIASDKFLSYGITSVCDASPGNTPHHYRRMDKLQQDGDFVPYVNMMVGAAHMGEFANQGLLLGTGNDKLSIGHVKIMVTLSSGSLSPTQEEMADLINKAHSLQLPVAIHTVEVKALEAALNALESAGPPPSDHVRDRIEHCSECPDNLLPRLARLGVAVVTNPGFIYHNGDRYLAETQEEHIPWLYRVQSLMERDVPVFAGSDAPAADPNPMAGINGAMTRRTSSGQQLNTGESIGLRRAISLYQLRLGETGQGGFHHRYIGDNGPADLVVLDRPLNEDQPEELLKTKVVFTIRDGEVVYEG